MKRLLGVMILFCAGCTDNQTVKSWGGTADLKLPDNQKLVMITWKEDQLWYLSRPMNVTDTASTYTFQEKSSYGMIEGTYNIIETKK